MINTECLSQLKITESFELRGLSLSLSPLPMQKCVFKIDFCHFFFICLQMFIIFAAHLMKNLGLNIGKKIICLPMNKL